MASEIRTFRDLEVWQRAIDLSLVAYKVSEKLPNAERFGLTSQIRRASTSVSANVAEGHELRGKSFLRHVKIALGSVAELESHIELAVRLGFLSSCEVDVLVREASRVGKMLNGLRRSLRRRLIGQVAGPAILIVLFAAIV